MCTNQYLFSENPLNYRLFVWILWKLRLVCMLLSHSGEYIWRICLRMQFATNSQWSQSDRQTFVGVRKARRTYSRLCLVTTRLSCREQIGSRQFSVHFADWTTYTVTTRSSVFFRWYICTAWCHLVFRHASVMTAFVIGWHLMTRESRFSQIIGWNVSLPGRNTVACDAWPSFGARRT